MTDIVERLLKAAEEIHSAQYAFFDNDELLREAAAEIERLEDLLVGHFDKTTEIAKWHARATLAEVEIERLRAEIKWLNESTSLGVLEVNKPYYKPQPQWVLDGYDDPLVWAEVQHEKEIEQVRAERDEWRDRYEAERRDHQATIEHCERELAMAK